MSGFVSITIRSNSLEAILGWLWLCSCFWLGDLGLGWVVGLEGGEGEVKGEVEVQVEGCGVGRGRGKNVNESEIGGIFGRNGG